MRSKFFICAALLSLSAESRAQPVVNSGAQIVTRGVQAAGVVSGTTTITGGATTQVCFNDGATLSCGDAAFVFDKATGTLTITTIASGFNVGNADTSITRSAAGVIAVEGDPVMSLNTSQTVTAQKIFTYVRMADGGYFLLSAGQGGNGPSFYYMSALTPDGLALGTGSLSNSIWLAESGDTVGSGNDLQNGDCGTSACIDPHFHFHSHNGANVTEYGTLFNDGVNSYLKTGVGGLGLPGMIFTVGTAPVVSNTTANSCGTTAATITGTDSTGVVTVGAGAGTSCTLALNVAALNRRQCWCSNETTLGNLCNTHYTDTTHTNLVGTFVAGDKVNYGCLSY